MDLAVLPHEWRSRPHDAGFSSEQVERKRWLCNSRIHSVDGGATVAVRDDATDDARHGWAFVDLEVDGDFVQRLATLDAPDGDDGVRPCATTDAASVLLRPQ